MDAGIIRGIGGDIGPKNIAGHEGRTVTHGLDGLRQRLAEPWRMSARFARWRAIVALDSGRPRRARISANAAAVAKYAAA